MGRHDFFSRYAPRASRLRFAVSRVAVLVLALVVLAWIGLSILLAPPPTTTQLQTVPLVSDPSPGAGTPSTAAPGTPPSGTAPPGDSAGALTVHVVGAVKKPGVYALPAGARIVDALEAAGGMRRGARPELLNLAARLSDGQQIVLPGNADAPAAAPSASSGAAGGKISLNSADAQQLQELPGIGPALAQRIIDFREAHGPFASVDELDAVSGIGPAVLGNLRELVQP